MSRNPTRAATLAALVVLALLAHAPAGASSAAPIVVDDGGDCRNADHASIQAAVDAAAPGDVVEVCDGTYEEQVVVPTSLTLRARPGHHPTIRLPADPATYTVAETAPSVEPVVFAYGGANHGGHVNGSGVVDVTVEGFVIDANDSVPAARRTVGVLYRNADGAILDNAVENLRVGGKETIGVLIYGDSDVEVAGNVVDGYERGGIGANGDGGDHPAPTVDVHDNVVRGGGAPGEAWAPNGIQIGFGASGRIVDNVVEDNVFAGSAWSASGILVFESDRVQVRGNVVRNADRGIAVGSWGWFRGSADGTTIVRNRVVEAAYGVVVQSVASDGVTTTDPSANDTKVVNNDLVGNATDADDVGVGLFEVDASAGHDPATAHTKVINNRIDDFNETVVDGATDTTVRAVR